MSPPRASSEDRRVALVTGASRGLGRAVAEHLATRGLRVFGCSRSAPEPPAVDVTHHAVDVREEAQVAALIRQIRREASRLDVLVNAAGLASMNLALLTPGASLQDMLDVNTAGTLIACREAAKLMQRGGGGRIVNLSSIASPLALEGHAGYVASKAAVEAASQVLAKELWGLDVTVNVLCLGPMPTRMTERLPSATKQRLLDALPSGRMGEVSELLHLVDFLIHEDSGFVTGQSLSNCGVRPR